MKPRIAFTNDNSSYRRASYQLDSEHFLEAELRRRSNLVAASLKRLIATLSLSGIILFLYFFASYCEAKSEIIINEKLSPDSKFLVKSLMRGRSGSWNLFLTILDQNTSTTAEIYVYSFDEKGDIFPYYSDLIVTNSEVSVGQFSDDGLIRTVFFETYTINEAFRE